MDDASFSLDFQHRVRFTDRAFDTSNPVLRDLLAAMGEAPVRCIAFVDEGVASTMPSVMDDIVSYAHAHPDVLTLVRPPRIVVGGEATKNDWTTVNHVLADINDAGICRHSCVLVVGGGAVLDAVGFAAATAHRGVRLIRFPTTTLSQDDSSIGVKNGINHFGKKNFLGTFTVPWAVINDRHFLHTLPDREWRAGLSEAVKVALLKDAAFFAEIEERASALTRRDENAIDLIVRRSAQLHLDHIVEGGDPFELLTARPLDFGHWLAHKLEQVTQFRLRHGEAVAIGLAVDSLYSAKIGALDPQTLVRVLRCLTSLGFALDDDALRDPDTLLDGLNDFREHLGGELTITLLNDVGRPFDAHHIDHDLMIQAIRDLRAWWQEYSTGAAVARIAPT